MTPLTQQLNGQLYEKDELTALLLDESAEAIFLRYALVVQGSERHLFPALALDDWGHERNTLALYQWLYDQGQHFPRSEVFGFDSYGRETQMFLRDLELYFKYPCYVYENRQATISEGKRLQIIFLSDSERDQTSEDMSVPETIKWPMRHAAVQWRKANSNTLQDAGWQAVL